MALGILLAILTGLSWVVTGAVVGLVERHGRPTGQLLAMRSAILLAAAILLLAVGGAVRDALLGRLGSIVSEKLISVKEIEAEPLTEP